MDEELAVQMPIVKEVLDALGIVRCELAGYEADDLLGHDQPPRKRKRRRMRHPHRRP